MEIDYKYVWNGGRTISDFDDIDIDIDAAKIKTDITFMVIKGCRTEELKSKMRKLNSLNASML